MIDESEIEDRLRRTFDAVAATTRVDTAPRARARRARFSLMSVAAVLIAALAIGIVMLFRAGGPAPTRVRTDSPASHPATTTAGLRSRPGMVVVAAEGGGPVGYVRESYVHMQVEEFMKTVNARTMWPVVDADGNVVGYIAPDIPFIPIAETKRPGFDIEKVRAARNGGCEEQVGQANFKQEFPRC